MKTANLEDDGANAGGIVRGHRAPKRATSGMPLVTDATGTEVLANRIHFADLTVSDDDENTAIISGASGGGGSSETFNPTDYGVVGDGVTDITEPLQDLIELATDNGTKSATLCFEPGVYLIGGALQDTGDFNGQILLPEVTGQQITITFCGPARPMIRLGTGDPQEGVAILRSTLTGASGTAAVISGGNSGSNRIDVVVKDLVSIAPDNPTLTWWNLSKTQNGLRDGLMIGTYTLIDGGTPSITEPTNSNAYGIKLPEFNEVAYAREQIFVVGFYTGVKHHELTYGDYITWLCRRGIEIGFSHHVGGMIRHQALSCIYGIYVSGANQVDILYDAEHRSASGFAQGNPAWAASVYDLDDATGLLRGYIQWFGVQAGVGVDRLFVKSGGTNVWAWEFGTSPPWAMVTEMIVDGHSVPFTHDEVLFNDAGNERLYADMV